MVVLSTLELPNFIDWFAGLAAFNFAYVGSDALRKLLKFDFSRLNDDYHRDSTALSEITNQSSLSQEKITDLQNYFKEQANTLKLKLDEYDFIINNTYHNQIRWNYIMVAFFCLIFVLLCAFSEFIVSDVPFCNLILLSIILIFTSNIYYLLYKSFIYGYNKPKRLSIGSWFIIVILSLMTVLLYYNPYDLIIVKDSITSESFLNLCYHIFNNYPHNSKENLKWGFVSMALIFSIAPFTSEFLVEAYYYTIKRWHYRSNIRDARKKKKQLQGIENLTKDLLVPKTWKEKILFWKN